MRVKQPNYKFSMRARKTHIVKEDLEETIAMKKKMMILELVEDKECNASNSEEVIKNIVNKINLFIPEISRIIILNS